MLLKASTTSAPSRNRAAGADQLTRWIADVEVEMVLSDRALLGGGAVGEAIRCEGADEFDAKGLVECHVNLCVRCTKPPRAQRPACRFAIRGRCASFLGAVGRS